MHELLGLSESTFDRRVKRGRYPAAAYHSVSGWPLWSPEQAKALLRERIERG